MWYVYTTADRKRYTVAQQPTGEYAFQVVGPMSYQDAWAWMKANGHG